MNDMELKNKYGLKKANAVVLFIQMALTVLGAALAAVMLIRTLASPQSALGVIETVVYFLAYAGMTVYAFRTHAREGDVYFQGVIYAYAAIIGVQLLQNGAFVADYGLNEGYALMINIFNIISLGNIIKFSDCLGNKKTALCYISIATALKLAGELILIILMARYIRFVHVLMSLSVPVLGVTIITGYLTRCYKRKA